MSNNKTECRIGLIGCGAIAELFHLPALTANPQTRNGLVLVDKNLDRLGPLKEKYGASFVTDDFKQLVGKVDGVIIATPPDTHHFIAKFFLENGIAVLCEKPLSNVTEEAKELVGIAASNNVALAVNQTRRFFPSYVKIRELIAAGELGTLKKIVYHDGVDFDWPAASKFHFEPKAKGTWSDTGVHLLDSVCFWLNAKPELVESLNDSRGGPESMATVRLKHEECDIEIKVSRLGRLMNGFKIEGTKGYIEAGAEDFREVVVHYNNGSKRKFPCTRKHLSYTDFAKPLIDNFADVVTKGAQPAVAGKEVIGTIELLQQAYDAVLPYEEPWNNHLAETASRISVRQPSMRVLVTGASGFLGSRLVEVLTKTEAATPVGAVRSWSRAARPARLAAEVAICDIMDPEVLLEATRNVDAVVHCAYTCDRESIVEGTKNLLAAANQNGLQKFVFLSSAEAYGTGHEGVVTEESSPNHEDDSYGAWKLAAEQLCQQSAGVRPTILRPSLIYGPGSGSWTMDVAARLQSGKWGLFEGFGDGLANLIYVDDLANAITLSLLHESAPGEVFNVAGGPPPTWNEYFHAMNEAIGLPPLEKITKSKSGLKTRIMHVTRTITSSIKARFEDQLMEIYMRNGFLGQMMRKLKGELDSTPSLDELTDLYCRQVTYNDDKIRRTLGYEHQFELADGVAASVDWLVRHELVPAETAKASDPYPAKRASNSPYTEVGA